MYAKLVVALCAMGVAHGSGLLGAGHLAYSNQALLGQAIVGNAYASYAAGPAIVSKTITPGSSSYSAYSSSTAHGSPVAVAPAVRFAAPAIAPAVATYAAGPAVVSTKTITPGSTSYSAYSSSVNHGSQVATLTAAAPAVAVEAAPAVAVEAAPAVAVEAARTVAVEAAPAVAVEAAQAVAIEAAPAVVSTKTITPGSTSYSAYSNSVAHGSPVATYAAAVPALAVSRAIAPAVAYSAGPAVAVSRTLTPYAAYGAYAPGVAYASGVPAINSYVATSPLLKSAVAYAGLPSVARFAYGAHAAW